MKFIKMNGIGNDYVFVDCRMQNVDDPEKTAVRISDRHRGIGSDGLVLMMPDPEADLSMRIFNADGSEAETCGNALRCIARYAYESGWCRKEKISLRTKAGISVLIPQIEDGEFVSASVDMGAVRELAGPMKVPVYEASFTGYYVNIGNPHFVIFGNLVTDQLLSKYGPVIETSPELKTTVNVEFVTRTGENSLRVKVWERGSGITRACGSGACAVYAAAVRKGICTGSSDIELDGGHLTVHTDTETGHIIQTGPAEISFTGEI